MCQQSSISVDRPFGQLSPVRSILYIFTVFFYSSFSLDGRHMTHLKTIVGSEVETALPHYFFFFLSLSLRPFPRVTLDPVLIMRLDINSGYGSPSIGWKRAAILSNRDRRRPPDRRKKTGGRPLAAQAETAVASGPFDRAR